MLKIKLFIFFTIITLLITVGYFSYSDFNTPTALSTDKDLVIIINAGSTSTRGHIFQVNKDKSIHEITKAVSKQPGISSFVNNKIDLELYINEFINHLKTNIQINNTDKVPVYFMATAGMRYIDLNSPEQATEIYNIIATQLYNNFDLKFIGTIGGREEALYDWITVNYLINKAYNFQQSYFVLDIGDVSIQLAYKETADNITKHDFRLSLDGYSQNLFIHSFLGLGYNNSIEFLSLSPNCTSRFNLNKCSLIARSLIKGFNVKNLTGDVSKHNIIAFDNIYKLYEYFEITNSKYPIKSLNQAIRAKCFVKKSDTGVDDIMKHCLGGIYISNLLTYGYGLNEQTDNKQFQIFKSINNTELDWSLGAAVYHSLSGYQGLI